MFTILILLLFQDSPKVSNNDFTLFSQKENFYLLKKDSLFEYRENRWSGTKHNLNLTNYAFNVVEDNNILFFIADGGGKVLSFTENKLEVIDETYFWFSKYLSFNFIRNKTLLSYGGYGHFVTRDDLIYFDNGSGEWLDFMTSSDEFLDLDLSRRSVIGSYDKNTDELYIGLGNRVKSLYSDVLKYNFKKNEWIKYADIGRNFGADNLVIDNYKFPLIVNVKEKITFDFLNKTYNVFKSNINVGSLVNTWSRIHYNRFTNQFIIARNSNDLTTFNIISEQEFFGNDYTTHSFKKDANKLTIFLVVLIALALALILIVFRFRKKQTTLMKINKNLKKIKLELDEDDLIFFEKIITSHPKAVKYQDLMNMLDDSLAYETKIKKIGASKLRIDFVLSKYCKSKDSILQSKKNIHDSRIKEMFIKTG